MKKSEENPILLPSSENSWEKEAAFNPSVVIDNRTTHVVYRAISEPQKIDGKEIWLSTIGHAISRDGVHFKDKHQLIKPEKKWEKYGCEDPRITKIDGRYFIFYTALSEYPFRSDGIKVAVAISRDLKTIDERHLVTPFNAKAMTLFPEKINGKYAAILTVNTDRPPARICLALFDKIEDIWSEKYWAEWYKNLDSKTLKLQKSFEDQTEVGANPIKTSRGWLLIYSYIENYFSENKVFTVVAALLDLKDPQKVIGRTERTILYPEEEYERYGLVPNVIFPTGALVKGSLLYIYYGAADTTGAMAYGKIKDIVDEIIHLSKIKLERYINNPIITPLKDHPWESRATFNPGAIYKGGKVHILYRAMSNENVATFGYASSKNGFDISERLETPIYEPREQFEQRLDPTDNSGCEDPRIVEIDNVMYVCYTAYDGKNEPRVALTTITSEDFLVKKWNWTKPILISPPYMSDKDASLFPRKINGKYYILHRLGADIWLDAVDDLKFKDNKWLGGEIIMKPRQNRWDSKKIGIASPPIETKYGWLLLYHGISKDKTYYRVKAALLDINDPRKVLARTTGAILEPEAYYEREGEVNNVVFPCGAVVLKGNLIVYYGGGDKNVGVASIKMSKLMKGLLSEVKRYQN